MPYLHVKLHHIQNISRSDKQRITDFERTTQITQFYNSLTHSLLTLYHTHTQVDLTDEKAK